MTPRLADNGLMLLVDVTSKNMIAQEWLPNIMDKGLANAGVSVIARNPYNNASFIVNHSRQHGDVSKIAWRLIKNK